MKQEAQSIQRTDVNDDDDGELISIPAEEGTIPPWSFELLGDVLATGRLEMTP